MLVNNKKEINDGMFDDDDDDDANASMHGCCCCWETCTLLHNAFESVLVISG